MRQLDEIRPHLTQPAPGPTSTIGAPVEHVNLATPVPGEIVLEKLIDTLLRTAIQHAGVERGLLILSRGAERRTAAEAMTGGATVIVRLRDEAVTAAAPPKAVLYHHFLRTLENIILDAAAEPNGQLRVDAIQRGNPLVRRKLSNLELDRGVKPTVELVWQRIHPDDSALVTQAISATSRGE